MCRLQYMLEVIRIVKKKGKQDKGRRVEVLEVLNGVKSRKVSRRKQHLRKDLKVVVEQAKEKNVPGRRNSQGRGPETEPSLSHLSNSKGQNGQNEMNKGEREANTEIRTVPGTAWYRALWSMVQTCSGKTSSKGVVNTAGMSTMNKRGEKSTKN